VQGLEQVIADLRDGGTLVLDQMNKKDLKLGQLCRILATEFNHNFQTNMYLTPPNGRGFGAHWDNHDVFILQVAGTKRWNIEKKRRAIPKKMQTMGDEGRELMGELHTFTLKQGDLIYIPRGFVHAAECGPEHSLHITTGVSGVYWEDMLHAAIAGMIEREERLRGPLPFGFLAAGPDRLVARAQTVLREVADEKFVKAVVGEFMDECIKQYKIDISGQVVDFLKPAPLLVSDIVGPRPGAVYNVHAEGETVRINIGTRSIVFLDIFKEAVEFALKTPSFAIGTLPGDLEDVERIALIDRLMQEGVIVRKSGD
jgi:hypothetical protein